MKLAVAGVLVLIPAAGRLVSSHLPFHNGSASVASTLLSPNRTSPPIGALFVSVSGSRGLDSATISSLTQQAAAEGLNSTVLHQGTIDLTTVSRAGGVIRTVPTGVGIPMSFLAVDPAGIESTTSLTGAEAASNGTIVVGSTAATLAGIADGDEVTFLGWNATDVTFRVGAVVPDEAMAALS